MPLLGFLIRASLIHGSDLNDVSGWSKAFVEHAIVVKIVWPEFEIFEACSLVNSVLDPDLSRISLYDA